MNRRVATAFAPGKLILLGEHSVVFGQPAIAAALDRGLEIEVSVAEKGAAPPSDPRTAKALARAAALFGLEGRDLTIGIRSAIPPAVGLGSSAALSLAMVRALSLLTERPLGPEEEQRFGGEVENVFHGTASGVDVAASGSGGVIFFRRGEPPEIERVRVAKPLEVVVGLSGETRSTAGPVERLRARVAERPETYGKIFALAGELAVAGREALERGDLDALGAAMDVGQGLLNACGVSTATLERMISAARAAGALGAKLTGGGGGGAMIALAPGTSATVREALAREGFDSFATALGGAEKNRESEEEDAIDRRNPA